MLNDTAQLTATRYRIGLVFTGSGRISASWGPTLRGGFGLALRSVSCSLGRAECRDCALARVCAYGYVFETPITGADQVMRRYPQAPHPYVFEPPLAGPARVAEGDTAGFGLVAVGRGRSYLPYYLLALQELGRRGLGRERVPFRVETLTGEDGAVVYQADSGRLTDQAPARAFGLEPGQSRPAVFSLLFETPLRLQADGRISRRPELQPLLANLSRRLFLLRHFHDDGGEEPLSPLFLDEGRRAKVLEASFTWREGSRYSQRQEREIPQGGAVGHLTVEADLGLLLPLLQAGEYVHLGKGATFGLGQYRLVEGGLP